MRCGVECLGCGRGAAGCVLLGLRCGYRQTGCGKPKKCTKKAAHDELPAVCQIVN